MPSLFSKRPYVTGKVKDVQHYHTKNIFHPQDDASAKPKSIPTATNSPSNAENLPFRRETNRENELKPGKWTGPSKSVGAKKHAVALSEIASKPTFAIHTDAVTPGKVKVTGSSEVMSKALSEKKREREVPLAIFEPPDPSKRPMYCKHMVYQVTRRI